MRHGGPPVKIAPGPLPFNPSLPVLYTTLKLLHVWKWYSF